MLKIFNCHSFDTEILDEFTKDPQIYVPVGSGGYKSAYVVNSDADYEDNISAYSNYVCEFAVIYVVGKNLDKFLGDDQYIGFGHYRRHLQIDLHIVSQLQRDVMIVPRKEILPVSVRQHYAYAHNAEDLKKFVCKFKCEFPSLADELDAFLSQNTIYWNNMFIMHVDKFREYFRFIEKCISISLELIDKKELDCRDAYQRRAFGFILERMTGFWLYHQDKTNASRLIETPNIWHNIKSIYS